jgi:hypothetical protein
MQVSILIWRESEVAISYKVRVSIYLMYVMDIQTTGSVGVGNCDEGILERILDSGIFCICWDDADIGE